jgi:uncharacterized repeat protein (TIGR02059 family)
MTYNLTLANVAPSTSAFTVRVNSSTRTVSSVAIVSGKVRLTLSSAIASGDNVTVAYTKPSTNPLQTSAGGQAATLSAQTVTNNVVAIPVFQSAVVENASPTVIEMTYSPSLAGIVPAASAFTVRVNSSTRTVSSVAIVSGRVRLTLSSAVVSGNVVTVAYAKPSTSPLQTSAGGLAATLSAQTVTNNCTLASNRNPAISISNPFAGSTFTAPASITINATASDPDGTVSKVEFFNGSTKLGEKTSSPWTFTWNNVSAGTYSLTAVATDNLNAKTTSSPVSITVNPPAPVPNQSPVISISNPTKGFKYIAPATITMDAIASDPDGSVRKVEFFNGSIKLTELTSAPWSFTWKDVEAGTYTITAVATDNLNSTAVSSPITIVVEAGTFYDFNSEIFNLYPNPNDGHFIIDFVDPLKTEESQVIITSADGRPIFKGNILREELTKKFDLPNLKAGMYIIILVGKEIIVTKKFIKN